MKKSIRKILLAVAILCSVKSEAQTIDTTTIEGLYQYIFNVLDKTQIPTHYLEEYGAPVLTMGRYNGLLTDSNVVDINVWRTLYWEIGSAYTGTGTNSFIPITTVNDTIQPLVSDTLPIPVPLLFATYNSVKSDAFSSNLLQVVNNQVMDVAGRQQSPYQQNSLFAAAPVIPYTKTGTASFIFKSNLFYTNGTATVSSISIDFADGTGYHPVTFNNALTVNYADTGVKQLKIKLVLSDNTTSECYSNFYVAKAVNQANTYDVSSFDFSQHFNATTSHSGGNVFVRYSRHGTERTITKPLIVIEGYDIHSAAPDVEPFNYSYSDFVNAVNIEAPPFDFNGHLDDIAGYDLIFVDYADGTDAITRNAALLEDVITWVNAQKAANGSAEQNVVMGISMGGLVARYALADMTKRSISTGTRLLITHDSPHRGANVPLGFQYLIEMAGGVHLFNYNVRDIYPAYDEVINLLTRPATQQLLLYRAIGPTTSANNTFLDGTYRSMITFGSGDPHPTYSFVATSLGSECGHSLFPAYQQLINSDVDAFAFFFPLLSYHFHTTVSSYALPNTGSTNTIASLLLKSKFKLFGLITISKQVYSNSANAPGTQLPIDGSPGGKITLIDGTAPRIKVFLPIPDIVGILGYVSANSGTLPKEFCFVPAGSALDVSPFNTNTFSQKFVAGNNPNYPATSNNYIAQETLSSGVANNDHPRFTARNAEWMFDQMENVPNTLSCSSECSPDLVVSVSANPICTSATASVANLSPSSTVSWSASPTGIVTITPNGQQATITKSSDGFVIITALVNSCNSYASTSIAVGKPQPGPITFPLIDATLGKLQAQVDPVPGAASYNWYKDGVLQSGHGAFIQMSITRNRCDVYYDIACEAANNCGTSSQKHAQAYVPPCGGLFAVSPNPASSSINISPVTGNSSSAVNATIDEVRIYDLQGNLKKDQQFGNATSALMNLQGLPNGSYIVEIINGSNSEKHQLVIQN